MDLNLTDSVSTSEWPLAQPVLAHSSQLKHPGEKNPQPPSEVLMPPSDFPASPLGPSSRVPAASTALPECPGAQPVRFPGENRYLCCINLKKKRKRKKGIILNLKYKRALSWVGIGDCTGLVLLGLEPKAIKSDSD